MIGELFLAAASRQAFAVEELSVQGKPLERKLDLFHPKYNDS
jgi:hypothetical protein